jgi:hypothetical protein
LRAVSTEHQWLSRFCWLCVFRDRDTMHAKVKLQVPHVSYQPIYLML